MRTFDADVAGAPDEVRPACERAHDGVQRCPLLLDRQARAAVDVVPRQRHVRRQRLCRAVKGG